MDTAMRRTGTTGRSIREIMRDEMVMRDRILALLRESPRTVPAVAEALGAEPCEVMIWMMAMRRYGRIEETGKPDDDGYFQYVPVEKADDANGVS